MADDLSREMEVYSRLLPSMAGDEGKFVVIFGETVVGKFESYSDALTAGYTAAGLKPFLVKRISSMPAVSFFTRELNPTFRHTN